MAKKEHLEILSALALMSGDLENGVNYLKFVESNCMNGALDLIKQGYAVKMQIGPSEDDNANYLLTRVGQIVLNNVSDYLGIYF